MIDIKYLTHSQCRSLYPRAYEEFVNFCKENKVDDPLPEHQFFTVGNLLLVAHQDVIHDVEPLEWNFDEEKWLFVDP